MKFLIGNALSPIFASKLREARCYVLHVRERDMQASLDEEIFDLAAREDRIIVSADTDLVHSWHSGTRETLVVIFRRTSGRRTELQAKLLLEYLPKVEESPNQRSVVVIVGAHLRIRSLLIDERYGS